jgi:hypothetical protein
MRQVYLVQDNSLAHLMDVMRSSHNFEARWENLGTYVIEFPSWLFTSKPQYERQFKKWGFRKNLKSLEWKAVSHHLRKRKREGKESDLYVDETLVPEKKLRKETARNGFVSVWELYAQGNVYRDETKRRLSWRKFLKRRALKCQREWSLAPLHLQARTFHR